VTCGDLIAVEALNLLEQFDLAAAGPESLLYYHLMAEALGQAFVDNFAYADDPLCSASPAAGLASKAYAARLARDFSPERAWPEIRPGDPWAAEPETPSLAEPLAALAPLAGTTTICAADSHGNFVSLITSLGSGFGSLVLVPGTGIYLGNAMQWFDPMPGKSNSVGPGRMPLYAAPVLLAFQGGQAVGAIGGSGGYRIQPAVLHTFVNTVDHGMSLQAALEAPRIHTEGATVDVEARLPVAVRDGLAALGHPVRVVESTPYLNSFGRAAGVWRDAAGRFHAAAEPLYGGTAGY
jgi:gamma-glutamyltranspeptidase/glutathione hydrolase